MKIAIVVGHNAKAQGAVRTTDMITEFAWNSDLAEQVKAFAPDDVRIFNRTPEGEYWQEIDRVYAQTDEWGAGLTAELHFNSVASSLPSGSVTLSSGTDASWELANLVQKETVAALGLRDRAVRVLGRKDRGGRSLWQGRAPAVMIEPFFGSNEHDCRTATRCKEKLALNLYFAFFEFLGSKRRG